LSLNFNNIEQNKTNFNSHMKLAIIFCLAITLIYGFMPKTVLAQINSTHLQNANLIDQYRKSGTAFNVSRGGYRTYVTMSAVAYSAKPGAGTYINLKAKVGRVAVDPKVIPLGSKLYIKSLDGSKDYGYAIAADTGTAIKNTYIDLFFNTRQECLNWGQRKVRVYILK
jgi:3D (Asp-Asp-Asp) domain-containing protein